MERALLPFAAAAAVLAPLMAGAQPAEIVLARPTLACRSLSEIRLWDNPAAASADLQRTISQGSCRNFSAGTAVTVAGQATLGAEYECLQVGAEADCAWAGAVSAQPTRR